MDLDLALFIELSRDPCLVSLHLKGIHYHSIFPSKEEDPLSPFFLYPSLSPTWAFDICLSLTSSDSILDAYDKKELIVEYSC